MKNIPFIKKLYKLSVDYMMKKSIKGAIESIENTPNVFYYHNEDLAELGFSCT